MRHHCLMDYNLDSLGPRNFEHLVQGLGHSEIGPGMSTFGDGPDGGREAKWEGPCKSLNSKTDWNGYGVVQAKFRVHPQGVDDNLQWLKTEISKELKQWAKPDTKRTRKPKYILFATNVRLSAADNGGKDRIAKHVSDKLNEHKLPIADFRVWDYDDIRTLLDGCRDLRIRYAAFLTPGDVIARIMSDLEWDDKVFSNAILSHAAKNFLDDNYLNLTQAGAVSDQQLSISDVVIDLPARISGRTLVHDQRVDNPEESAGIAAQLIGIFNLKSSEDDPFGTRRAVVIGGPGQGKSTVTQWLAQIYRAEFIRNTMLAADAEVKNPRERLAARCKELGLPKIAARRWPFRIILSEFADYLSEAAGKTLLGFISERISARSNVEVSPRQMMKWLSSYPWLLLIDGLDEVPTTSNRTAVMTAIRDFFLEAATARADVAVVATTRPQGYSDEFPPDRYIEFDLIPLDPPKALEYAEGLIAVRHGVGTADADKVLHRIERAIAEPMTARLMETPLQVTILTVLIEKLGKAPRERWRLFSQYYRVISQREQEKGGELAELLQRYEADVDFLHRHIGDLLQRRSSMAGDTSATISKTEFEQIIMQRLSDQGHDPDEVEELRGEFARLVTDRLVFLALVTADKIGFELRSLQEFMAAEYVLSLPESEIVPRLRLLSVNSFWRNVALFIAGGIFANREALKAEVVLLCQEMNRSTNNLLSMEIVRPGSDLAVDILIDGSCEAQPKYARGLASVGTEIIEGARSERLSELASVTDKSARKVIRSSAHDRRLAERSIWENRIVLAAEMARLNPEPEDQAFLNDLVSSARANDLTILAQIAFEKFDLDLAAILEDKICNVDPCKIVRTTEHRFRMQSFSTDGDEAPSETSWLVRLEKLFAYGSRNAFPIWVDQGHSADKGKHPIFEILFAPISAQAEHWQWVLELGEGNQNWDMIRAVARFCVSPSSETLGSTLSTLAEFRVADIRRLRATPWVIAACVENAAILGGCRGGDTADRFRAQMQHLAARALEGSLGDYEDWALAEDRWQTNGVNLATEEIAVVHDRLEDGEWEIPFTKNIATNDFIINGVGSSARRVSPDNYRDAVSIIKSLVSKLGTVSSGAAHGGLLSTISFLSSVTMNVYRIPTIFAEDGAPEESDVEAHLSELRDALASIDWTLSRGAVWPLWLEPRRNEDFTENDVRLIQNISRCSRVARRIGTESASIRRLRESTKSPREEYLLARLEMVLDPGSATHITLPPPDLSDKIIDPLTVPAWRLANGTVTEISSGALDNEIRMLCTDQRSSFNVGWLSALARERADEESLELLARASILMANSNPDIAAEFLHDAEFISNTLPISEEVMKE